MLLAHVVAQREQPWLFVQRGLDWRWRSFGAVAARVERLRAALAAGLGGPPARIGFEDSGRPSAIALDLAIQAAGACAAPLPPGLTGTALAAALAERGCAALAVFAAAAGAPPALAGEVAGPSGGGERPAAVVGAPGVLVLHLARDEPSEREAPPPSAPWRGGPVLVAEGAGWREIAQTDLVAGAVELAARLAPGRPWRRGREVLVLPRPLADPAGRRLAAWALAAGAALALEPDRGNLAAAAAWVRPTVFAGDPAEVAALRAVVEPRRRRRRGLPLRRLHTVAVLGGAPPPAAERAFWTGRGVAVTVV